MTFKSGLIAAALVAVGCTAGDVTEDPMLTVAEAIGDAQTTEIPAGLELVAGPPGPPVDARKWEHEGLHCDAEPERTTVEVCGKALPAELHLAWSDCEIRPRMHKGRGPSEGSDAAPSPLRSSGTVDVLSTLEPVGECSETPTIQARKQSTHEIQHTAEDGSVKKLSGTVTSTSVRGPEAGPHTRSSTFDTTRTLLDADGNTLESTHVAGTLEVSSDRSAETPAHTSNGSFTVTLADGSSSTVTLTDVVRAPPPVCAWPLSGTLQRVEADGTSHVLSFGPECGQATLDGEALTLPSRPHRGGGHGGRGDGGKGPRPPGGR